MNVRDLEEDDRIAGHRFSPAYLRHARKGGMYVALAAGKDGYLYGGAEAGLLLHTTRGIALRTRSVFGATETFRPLLASLRDRAIGLGCSVMYLASSPHLPELCTAAKASGFVRIEREFAMWRGNAPVTSIASPGMIVRPMRVDEYPDIRERLLRYVSNGDYVVQPHELRRFLAGRMFVPYVGEIDGVVIGYAELAAFHTALAACRVGRIERVVVEPSARGRNVSRAIVGELLRHAASLGCEKVDLQVHDGNIPAIRTYNSLGFIRTDDVLYRSVL